VTIITNPNLATYQPRRNLVTRRKLAAAAVILSLIGTGLASWATISDSLTVTTDFSVINVDLKANNAQSLAFAYQFTGAGSEQRNTLLAMSNAGNAELRYALRTTATSNNGAAAKIRADVWSVAGSADCPSNGATPTGTQITPSVNNALDDPAFGDPAAGNQGGDRLLAASASEFLCAHYFVNAANQLGASDTAQQIMTFSAEATNSGS
jgi:hypothetical protein